MLLHAALLWMTSTSFAGELAGVKMADTLAHPSGTELVLNGMGLREKWWIDVYVGGLYLPAKSSDAKAILASDSPRRVVMDFIYSKVSQAKMIGVFKDGLAKVPEAAAMTEETNQLVSWIDRDVVRGDKVVLDYTPGTGLTFSVNGTAKGTIASKAFADGIFAIFIGPDPASDQLKQGMLGR
ncbi:MAG: chalcone isomerase family protein [Myxococcota bacterium]